MVVSVLLVIGGLAACNSEPAPALQPMHFNIDPGEVGAPVEAADLGIRFQPPAAWTTRPADLDSLAHVLADQASALRPRYVFAHPSNGSFVRIGVGHAQALDAQVAHYDSVMVPRFTNATVQKGAYLKDGIPITQFLVQSSEGVTFTLFFAAPKGGVIQFDYFSPTAVYPGQIKAIESSIGSIQVLG